jgi:transcriptional regulator with XRE-family HTH domain
MTRPKENPAIWREVGGRIRSYRRSQGMSVDALAEKVGVNRQQIIRIEAGLVGTTLERLRLIAQALRVSEPDLLAPDWTPKSDEMEVAFRGRGLSDDEIARVLEFIKLIEGARKD